MKDTCLYFYGCKVRPLSICRKDFDRCTIYQRIRVLDRHKPKTGLEKFIKRYGLDYRQMFIGSKV